VTRRPLSSPSEVSTFSSNLNLMETFHGLAKEGRDGKAALLSPLT
jgi:hypothetical protein